MTPRFDPYAVSPPGESWGFIVDDEPIRRAPAGSDHLLEPDTGAEQEGPFTVGPRVDHADADPADRMHLERVDERLRGIAGAARVAQRLGVHVGGPARERSQRGARVQQPGRGFVERAVTGEHRDHIEVVVGGGACEQGRVTAPRGLGDLDLVVCREDPPDERALVRGHG